MLRTFPELGPVIERLHAEHEDVMGLVAAPAEHLRAHLEFEESSLFPYFRRMDTDWHYD